MRFEVIGAGAIGLLFSGKLALAGHQVRLWTRTSEQADLINEQGIYIQQQGSSGHVIRDGIVATGWTIYNRRNFLDEVPAPWIMLTVKQRHINEEIIEGLRCLLREDSRLLCFQNGMGHIERLKEELDAQIIAALTTEGAKRMDGRSVQATTGGQTRIGTETRIDNHQQYDQLEKLSSQLSGAGLLTTVSKDIVREMYRKLLINATINPLTAIWRIPNGELLSSDHRRRMLHAVIQEGQAVYDALGISYDQDIAEQIEQVCRSTSNNISSMLTDVLGGNETEVDYINGYLVKLALKSNMAVTIHQLLYALVKGNGTNS